MFIEERGRATIRNIDLFDQYVNDLSRNDRVACVHVVLLASSY